MKASDGVTIESNSSAAAWQTTWPFKPPTWLRMTTVGVGEEIVMSPRSDGTTEDRFRSCLGEETTTSLVSLQDFR